MRFFDKVRNVFLEPDAADAELYGFIAEEVASGNIREGLWAKALTEAEFDMNRAKSIYMRMAVAELKSEIIQSHKIDLINSHRLQQQDAENRRIMQAATASREAEMMSHAYDLYNSAKYSESIEGLDLLFRRKGDLSAAACLTHIYINGLDSNDPNIPLAMSYADHAETCQDPKVRKYLADTLRKFNEIRALPNYEFAAKSGDAEAKSIAKQLREVLEHEKKIPKRGFF